MALTVNFIAGAESLSSQEVEASSSNVQVTGVDSRSGGGCYSIAGSTGQVRFTIDRAGVSEAGTKKIVGFGIKHNALPTGTRTLAYWDGPASTSEWELIVQSDGTVKFYHGNNGSQALLGSGAGDLVGNTWTYFEVYWDSAASADYEVFQDGVSIYSGTGTGDFRTGGAAGNYVQMPNGLSSYTTRVDDVYCISDVTDADDRWGDVEIQGFWNTSATATSTYGDNLGVGDWTCQGPGAWTSIQGEMTGSGDIGVRIVDTSDTAGSTNGPNDEWGDTTDVKAYRLAYSAKRSGGGGSTHSIRIGGSVSRQSATVALDSSQLFFDNMFTASSVNTAISTGGLSYGFGTSGGQDSECYGIIVEVANAVDFVTSSPRTVTGTTSAIELDGTNHDATVNAEREVTQALPEAVAVAGTDATVQIAENRDITATTEAVAVTGTLATVERNRTTAGATEVITTSSDTAVIGRVPNVPLVVTGTTAGIESTTISAVNQVNRQRGISGYVVRIYAFETTGVVSETGYYDGTFWSDVGGDWIQVSNIFDGNLDSGFGSNLVNRTPSEITPIHATGISLVDNGKPPLKVKVRHRANANGVIGTGGDPLASEVDYLLDGVVVGTTSVQTGNLATEEITLPRPAGGWTWDKVDSIEIDIAARGNADSEPATTVGGVEIDNWSGGGSAPPGLNKQRGVNGLTAPVTATANPATVKIDRGVTGVTEVVEAAGTLANINRTRSVSAAPEVVTLIASASVVNAGRIVLGATEVVNAVGEDATVDTGSGAVPRVVTGTTEAITATENASTVNRTRSVSAAPEVVTLIESASVVNAGRVVPGATEVVSLDGTSYPADIAFPRTITGITEVITQISNDATVEKGAAVPRVVTGTTEVITASSTGGAVNAERIVAGTTEVVALSATPAGVNGRRVVGASVALNALAENAATVNAARLVAGVSEEITVAGTLATIDFQTNRLVAGLTAGISLAENAAGVNMTRGVQSAVEVLLAEANAASVTKVRPVVGTTAAIALTANQSATGRSRILQSVAEEILVSGTGATVFRGVNLDITGVTAGILLTENAATIANGRIIVCSTSSALLTALGSFVNSSRQVGGATELIEVTTARAALLKTRTGAQPGSLIYAHPDIEAYVVVDDRMIQL